MKIHWAQTQKELEPSKRVCQRFAQGCIRETAVNSQEHACIPVAAADTHRHTHDRRIK